MKEFFKEKNTNCFGVLYLTPLVIVYIVCGIYV